MLPRVFSNQSGVRQNGPRVTSLTPTFPHLARDAKRTKVAKKTCLTKMLRGEGGGGDLRCTPIRFMPQELETTAQTSTFVSEEQFPRTFSGLTSTLAEVYGGFTCTCYEDKLKEHLFFQPPRVVGRHARIDQDIFC